MRLLFLLFFISTLSYLVQSDHYPQRNKSITLIQLGPVPKTIITEIKDTLQKFFNLPILLLPEQPLPNHAYYKPRNRYNAKSILQYLNSKFDTLPGKLLAITSKDIYCYESPSNPTHGILGYGQIHDQACIISTHRIKSLSNIKKTAIHETLHTLGLHHCQNKTCLMSPGTKNTNSSISKESQLCPSCKSYLPQNILKN